MARASAAVGATCPPGLSGCVDRPLSSGEVELVAVVKGSQSGAFGCVAPAVGDHVSQRTAGVRRA